MCCFLRKDVGVLQRSGGASDMALDSVSKEYFVGNPSYTMFRDGMEVVPAISENGTGVYYVSCLFCVLFEWRVGRNAQSGGVSKRLRSSRLGCSGKTMGLRNQGSTTR
jgi:hypothetical protein